MEIPDIDILENDILEKYPEVLEILLRDRTTQKNIFWATDNYQELGEAYRFLSHINTNSITGQNGQVIMPRVKKGKVLQQTRVREMAEVFTPSWICNAQNNLIDNVWFQKENVFNYHLTLPDGKQSWQVNKDKILFPDGKTWVDYIKDTRIEMACGEAPYITSRYDTTTGDFIPIESRIGLLDRKLRVINENVNNPREWLAAAQIAYKNIYAFEWQGDSLLLAREAMLATFIENYNLIFGRTPELKFIKYVACIISWNVWQMDGIKGVVPRSCTSKIKEKENLFGGIDKESSVCVGCKKNDIKLHNGIYCMLRIWNKEELKPGKLDRKMKFVDLIDTKNK
jgi:hypothetical protein